MNKLLLIGIPLLFLNSCKKQVKETTTISEKEPEKQEVVIAKPIQRNTPISLDTTFARQLSEKEISSIFTRRREFKLGISNDIFQAYSYKDKTGEYYLALTDHRKTITEEKDTLYDNIYLVSVNNTKNQFKKRSSATDEIDGDWETSIGYWNMYSEISDIDNDSIVDLILVYGTTGQDMYNDGKAKIMIYHNNKRVSIKHQNSDYDGRLTKINSKFYSLPESIQNAVKDKMKLMVKNGHAVFTEDWEKKMANDNATRLEDL